jgi:transcriptional regulator with XRE-family HTH domain
LSDERSANALDRHIGRVVRTRRLALQMSQGRLAEILGITFQQVQKYEQGVNRIAASRLYDIADGLDMPVSAFFEGLRGKRKGRTAGDDIEEALSTSGAHELVRTYAGIKSAARRRRVLEFSKAMQDEE